MLSIKSQFCFSEDYLHQGCTILLLRATFQLILAPAPNKTLEPVNQGVQWHFRNNKQETHEVTVEFFLQP